MSLKMATFKHDRISVFLVWFFRYAELQLIVLCGNAVAPRSAVDVFVTHVESILMQYF
jgi:hypothetical protein